MDPQRKGPLGRFGSRVIVRAVLVGLAAGLVSGLFGVGGGILIVPGLVFLVGMDQRLAHGTSLAAIAPIAAAALVGYWLDALVFWEATPLLIAGSVVGAFIGTLLLDRVPIRTLQVGFAVLALVTAVRLFFSVEGAPTDLDVPLGLALIAVGLAAGAVAGLMGVGGGVLMVPAMIILFGIPDAVAKGTSLAVILPTAIVGTVRNVARENADLRVASAVGMGGIVSAFVASRIAIDLDPRLSQALFGALLVVVAWRMLAGTRVS